MLDYITSADRAYIGHDLPPSVVRYVFAPGEAGSHRPKQGLKAIAAAVMLVGYMLFGGEAMLRIAAIRSLFTG